MVFYQPVADHYVLLETVRLHWWQVVPMAPSVEFCLIAVTVFVSGIQSATCSSSIKMTSPSEFTWWYLLLFCLSPQYTIEIILILYTPTRTSDKCKFLSLSSIMYCRYGEVDAKWFPGVINDIVFSDKSSFWADFIPKLKVLTGFESLTLKTH